MNREILQKAANEAKGLAIDAVFDKASGHMGLPIGCGEIGAALFGSLLNVNPDEPRWLNRDRFVLSGGHGSMFLYSWLHLSGFALPLEELKNFRSKGSMTPGHPEFRDTPGVECTTGPLGQGVANAVGFAISAKHAAARFNTETHEIFNQMVYCLAGDGCLQEGISREAANIAAVLKLDNLILIHDSNKITLDAPIGTSQCENLEASFIAMGWETLSIDGNDVSMVEAAIRRLRSNKDGRPKLLVANTTIAKGVPGIEGTTKGHGEGGAVFWKEAHANWGLPEEKYFVSDDVRRHMAELKITRIEQCAQWHAMFEEWQAANPALAAELAEGCDVCAEGVCPEKMSAAIPAFPEGSKLATRASGGVVENAVGTACSSLLSACADLFSSNKNYLNGAGDFSATDYAGRNLWMGIREHAMGAICNGIAYDGLFRASCATFCVFVDYMRPAIRIAALSHLPVTYVLTHDSVAVGEDGPTHQPIETVSALRLIPNLDVLRPADEEEAAGAWMAAMQRADGPSALILSRQNIPSLAIASPELSVEARRMGTIKGAYIALKETTPEPKAIIIATGSEVNVALEAAKQLGEGVRVVSMPSMFRFEQQSDAYKEEVLPAACTTRLAVEAGSGALWHRYVPCAKGIISIDSYGFSAPGDLVLKELGMSAENVVARAQELMA